jgi:hypothetical protein
MPAALLPNGTKTWDRVRFDLAPRSWAGNIASLADAAPGDTAPHHSNGVLHGYEPVTMYAALTIDCANQPLAGFRGAANFATFEHGYPGSDVGGNSMTNVHPRPGSEYSDTSPP